MIRADERSQKYGMSHLIHSIQEMYSKMEVEFEDRISIAITFSLLLIWHITLVLFDYPLMSVLILWIGMITLSIIYSIVYKRKKRDMTIFKYRFLASAVPIYPVLFYYVYALVLNGKIGGSFRFLPFFVIFAMLILNASVVYYFQIIKK